MLEPKEYLRAGFGNGDDASVSRFLLFGGWEPNPLSAPEDSPVGDPEDSSLSTCDDDSPWDDWLLTLKSDTSLGSSVSTSFRAVRTRDNNLPFLAAALPGRLFAMEDDPLGLGERDIAKGDIATGELNWASSGSVSLGGFEGELSEAIGFVGAMVGAAGLAFCKSVCGLKKSDIADCLFGVLKGTVRRVSKNSTKLQVPHEPY